MKTIQFDTSTIASKRAFGEALDDVMAYPGWYGQAMDEWIEMVSYFDRPNGSNPRQRSNRGELFVIELIDSAGFFTRAPNLFRDFMNQMRIINLRYRERHGKTIIAIVYS